MRRTLVLATLLLTTLGVAGCSSGLSTADMLNSPARSSMSSDGLLQSENFAGSDAESMDRTAAGEQIYIVNGYLSLTVEKPVEAAREVAQIVEKSGGRVDARTENAPKGTDRANAQLTVRIPTDKLTATLDKLKELGTVEQVEQSQANVTAEVRDVDARISALRTSVDRLLALMAKADTTADLISIETALSARQADLESMEAQKRSLDDQIALSTFTVYLGSEADAPVEDPDTFVTGLLAGWDAFVGFFAFLLVALGVLVPWLALAGVITLIAMALVRRRIKKKKKTAAATP